ncbi:hypothetical protein HY488_00160 [Candidatus Woesearchaeota archaeon]|nr:hypothetical protein [Candidatus Woesearchaeota archaeon]
MTLKSITQQRRVTFDVRDIKVCAAQLPQATSRVTQQREQKEITTPIEERGVFERFKDGVLNVFGGELVPEEGASPTVGGIVALAIVTAGLLVYGLYRRRTLQL